jgi:hypothetical protein
MSAAFFYLVAPNEFACTDAGTDEDQRWTIEAPTVDVYLRDVRRDSGNDPEYDVVRPPPPALDATPAGRTAATGTISESRTEKG